MHVSIASLVSLALIGVCGCARNLGDNQRHALSDPVSFSGDRCVVVFGEPQAYAPWVIRLSSRGELRENLHTVTDWGLDESIKLLVWRRELLVRIVVADLNSVSLGALAHHVQRFESSAHRHLPDGQVLRIYVVGRDATTRPTAPSAPSTRTSYRAVPHDGGRV
jgi:hypothetical protein